MGHHLLTKARNRRVEALWAQRLGTRLKAEVAEAAGCAKTSALCAGAALAATHNHVRVFSAHA
jgi:hypothetical protein